MRMLPGHRGAGWTVPARTARPTARQTLSFIAVLRSMRPVARQQLTANRSLRPTSIFATFLSAVALGNTKLSNFFFCLFVQLSFIKLAQTLDVSWELLSLAVLRTEGLPLSLRSLSWILHIVYNTDRERR